MRLQYKANKTFALIHKEKSLYIFVRGPVGSGKSSGSVMHLFLHALRQVPDKNGVRKSRYGVIRATYPSLKSTTIKTWEHWFEDDITIVHDTPIRGTVRFNLPDGTKLHMEVVFLAIESEKDVNKLQSLEFTAAHCNEAAELDEAVFQMLKSRVNRYPAAEDGGAVDPFILCDYNSVSTDHWLYHLAEEIPKEDLEGHAFYHQPPGAIKVGNKFVDNPEADNIEFLPKDYYKNICLGNDGDYINVFVLNNYGEVRSGKPVYKDYSDKDHCATLPFRPLNGLPIIIGVDQGLTPAAIFTQQAPDGQIRVFDEITTEDCSLHEFCNDVLWPKINTEYPEFKNYITLIVDPATKQRSMNDKKAGTEIIKEAGFKYRTARTNNATKRREAVVNFLRLRDKFKISPRCRVLRKGFIAEYKYDEIRSAQSALFKETPAKNEYSHPHDALQYAVLEYYNPTTRRRAFTRSQYKAASSIGGY